jgi:hypothetical protein
MVMEYDMKIRFIALILLVQLAISSAGCLSMAPAPSALPTPLPPATQIAESTSAAIILGDLALQLTDVPSDYLLKDRTVTAYSEVSPIAHDLGWRQGYRVVFYRMDRERDDMTLISQAISVYPPENIGKVYDLETEGILSGLNGSKRYEIPFPAAGDRSIAFRETRVGDPQDFAKYTVIFKKKNVFETITMEGTTTDYEALKNVVRIAAEKIR